MTQNIVKISASQIDTFLSCRKKYLFSRIMNIQPVERPEALDFGSAVHRGLASILRSIADTNIDGITIEQITNAREIARQYALPAVREYCEEYALDDESRCKACALIDSYVDVYFVEDLQNFEVLDVEKYFDMEFWKKDESSFHLHGYFDGIIRNRHTGDVFVIEHKTTGMMSESYLQKASYDWQVTIYLTACAQLYGGCAGVIYDVLSKPKHSMGRGESDEEFEARKAASKTGRIKRKEAETAEQFTARIQASFTDDTFVRDTIGVTPGELGTRMAELTWILNDMAAVANKFGYYKCPGNCLKFGACEYMDLCSGKVTTDNLGDKFVNCNDADREN